MPTPLRDDILADTTSRPQPKPRQRKDRAVPIIQSPPPPPSTPPHVAQMVEMGFIREQVQLAIEVS